jgi:hypothetical protein
MRKASSPSRAIAAAIALVVRSKTPETSGCRVRAALPPSDPHIYYLSVQETITA